MSAPSIVLTRAYDPPPICFKEIARYAGVHDKSFEIDNELQSEICKISQQLTYKVCFSEYSLKDEGNCLDLGFAKTDSQDLRRALVGCERIVLFAATVGDTVDRLIRRYSAISPTKALWLQAFGSERVECLCDVFCRDIRETKQAEGYRTRPRFSPGYGDLPLSMQTDIFAVLSPWRRIGLSLQQSLLMSPSKSVTALIGVGR